MPSNGNLMRKLSGSNIGAKASRTGAATVIAPGSHKRG